MLSPKCGSHLCTLVQPCHSIGMHTKAVDTVLGSATQKTVPHTQCVIVSDTIIGLVLTLPPSFHTQTQCNCVTFFAPLFFIVAQHAHCYHFPKHSICTACVMLLRRGCHVHCSLLFLSRHTLCIFTTFPTLNYTYNNTSRLRSLRLQRLGEDTVLSSTAITTSVPNNNRSYRQHLGGWVFPFNNNDGNNNNNLRPRRQQHLEGMGFLLQQQHRFPFVCGRQSFSETGSRLSLIPRTPLHTHTYNNNDILRDASTASCSKTLRRWNLLEPHRQRLPLQ